MTLRAMGPYNGTLPEPTGMIVSFMSGSGNNMPYLKYTQLCEAPGVNFSYWRMDPDDPVRLARLNDFAWGYDDYRPTGKGFQIRGELIADRIQRWNFPYTVGETTRETWQRGSGIDPKMLYDQYRSNHANLHRAVRVLTALGSATWGGNTGTPVTLLSQADAFFNKSSGQQYLASGNDNPNFQVIKRTFQRVKRVINLSTNTQLDGTELVAVMSPSVAIAIAESGEMVEYLKGSPFAKELMHPNMVNWNLPSTYAGFQLVVEDTPRCFIDQNADGTVADITVSAQKDYILNSDTMYFLSRPGGLTAQVGGRSYSTVQCWHHKGPARVEAFSEPKHDLIEGHVVMEDKVVIPAVISGYKLTDVLG